MDEYRKLWLAVMVQALKDVKGLTKTSVFGYDETREWMLRARAWFQSRLESVGSFRWCCMALELRPEKVLKFVFRQRLAR